MTRNEARAFDQAVLAVLDIASRTATGLRAQPDWKPGREGAASALEELAAAGELLLIDKPGDESVTVSSGGSPKPLSPASGAILESVSGC